MNSLSQERSFSERNPKGALLFLEEKTKREEQI